MVKVALDAAVAGFSRLVAFGAGLLFDRLEVAHELRRIGLCGPFCFLFPACGSGERVVETGVFGESLVATSAIGEEKVCRVVVTGERVAGGTFPGALPLDARTGEPAGFASDLVNRVALQAAS